MRWGIMLRSIPACLALLFLTESACAGRVFVVDQPEGLPGLLRSAALDGSNQNVLWTSPVVSDMRGVAVAGNSVVFAYCDTSTGTPLQVSLRSGPFSAPDGGYLPQTILALPDGEAGSLVNPVSDVEFAAGFLYFSQAGSMQLKRCGMDGDGLTTVLTHPGNGALLRDRGPYFFGLDPQGTMAYWAVITTSGDTQTQYRRGTLPLPADPGPGAVDAAWTLTTPSRTRDIAIDSGAPGGAQLYWCDRQNGAVYAEPASGGTRRVVLSGLNAPHGLVLDTFAGKAYLADTGKRGNGNQASSHRALRFNMDGSGGIEWLTPPSVIAEPWDIAVALGSTDFAEWRTRFFMSGAPLQGRDDDPDADGLTNAAEYAFFTHPLLADAAQATNVIEVQPGQLRIALRPQTDTPVRVEVSTDLQTWHWNGDSTGLNYTSLSGPVPRDDESTWLTVTLLRPGAAGRTYARLRALPPS
jgi:hypothetical protein